MIAKKTILSRIVTIPLLLLVLSNAAIFPLYSIQLQPVKQFVQKNVLTWPMALSLASYSYTTFSKANQDAAFSTAHEMVDSSIIALINSVIDDMKKTIVHGKPEYPEGLTIHIKKMNKDASFTFAKDFQFIGIAPTDKTLYIDEDYFKDIQSQEAQKLIIRTAIKQYLNNIYFKTCSSRFLVSSISAIGAVSVSNYVFGTLSNWSYKALNSYFSSPGINNNALYNNSIEVVKWLGIIASSVIIGGFVYNKIYNFLDKPIQKYIKNKQTQFDKKSIEHLKSDQEKKELTKKLIGLGSGLKRNNSIYKAMMQHRITDIFGSQMYNDVSNEFVKPTEKCKREFDKIKHDPEAINRFIENLLQIAVSNSIDVGAIKKYIVDSIMDDIKKEFNQLKKNNSNDGLIQFLVILDERPNSYAQDIQQELLDCISTFKEETVLPFLSNISQTVLV